MLDYNIVLTHYSTCINTSLINASNPLEEEIIRALMTAMNPLVYCICGHSLACTYPPGGPLVLANSPLSSRGSSFFWCRLELAIYFRRVSCDQDAAKFINLFMEAINSGQSSRARRAGTERRITDAPHSAIRQHQV